MDYFELYDNLEKAIKVERDHKYVDFVGNKTIFSKYILSALYQILKKVNQTEKIKLKEIIFCFEQYQFDSVAGRQSSLEKLEKILKYYKKQFKKTEAKPISKDVWQNEIDHR